MHVFAPYPIEAAMFARHGAGLFPIVANIYGIVFRFQPFSQKTGQSHIIFGDENAYGIPLMSSRRIHS